MQQIYQMKRNIAQCLLMFETCKYAKRITYNIHVEYWFQSSQKHCFSRANFPKVSNAKRVESWNTVCLNLWPDPMFLRFQQKISVTYRSLPFRSKGIVRCISVFRLLLSDKRCDLYCC